MINNSTNHYCYQISFGLNLNEYKQLLFGINSKVVLIAREIHAIKTKILDICKD